MNSLEDLRDLIIYQSKNNENISVDVLYNNEDFWLTQKSMGKLFGVAENNITYHLQNIFADKELEENRTTQKIRVVQKEGNRNVYFYKTSNSIKVIYITSGFAPYSEEVICTISKNTKNKKIKNIVIKECKPENIIIEKDGEIKEFKYGEQVWSSGFTGMQGMLAVDGPVYYLKFEK